MTPLRLRRQPAPIEIKRGVRRKFGRFQTVLRQRRRGKKSSDEKKANKSMHDEHPSGKPFPPITCLHGKTGNASCLRKDGKAPFRGEFPEYGTGPEAQRAETDLRRRLGGRACGTSIFRRCQITCGVILSDLKDH